MEWGREVQTGFEGAGIGPVQGGNRRPQVSTVKELLQRSQKKDEQELRIKNLPQQGIRGFNTIRESSRLNYPNGFTSWCTWSATDCA